MRSSIFVLANAGISCEGVAGAASSPVTTGDVIGLVVGKLSGIAGFTWCAHCLGLAVLSDGVAWASERSQLQSRASSSRSPILGQRIRAPASVRVQRLTVGLNRAATQPVCRWHAKRVLG